MPPWQWVKLQGNQLTLPSDQPFDLASMGTECTQLVKHLLASKPAVQLHTSMALPGVTLLGAPLHLKQVGHHRPTRSCLTPTAPRAHA